MPSGLNTHGNANKLLFWYFDTGRPHFIVLCFIDFCRYCTFYKLNVCGITASSKYVGTIFPAARTQVMSLCHILVILAILQTFSLLL